MLYFDDLSADGQLGYLADGLTEGLIRQLSQVRSLDVVSRNGVEPFRGASVERADSIARALGAGTLVVGSVQPAAAGRVRVTAQLLDGASATPAGGRPTTFELASDAFLGAGDSVAQSIARTLREWLGEEIAVRETRAGTSSLAAWTAYQRGERALRDAERRIQAGETADAEVLLARADSFLAVAEGEDARWPDPIIERGWVASGLADLVRGDPSAERVRAGLAHADRALSLDGSSAQAMALRGTLRAKLYWLRVTPDQSEWEQLLYSARDDLQEATRADATLAQAWVTLSDVLYEPQITDVAGAQLAARRGLEEDAFLKGADRLMNSLFWASLDQEQFPEARRWCSEGASRFPRQAAFQLCQLWLMATPAVEADVPRARGLVARLDTLLPDSRPGAFGRAEARVVLGGVMGRAGMRDSAVRVLQDVQRNTSYEVDPDQALVGRIAYMYSLAGELDTAIDLLKQYVAANPHHAFLESAGTMWWWREIRAHPRYAEVEAAGR